VSAAATTALPRPAAGSAAVNPWLIAVLVAFASFMESLDTTIANVALPYVAGGLGVSEDEASWVITTYLVANAVSLTASSYLAQRLGRKSFFLTCLALFTASSVLCGFAPNLQALLLFRVLQGLAGGGMVPASQSILADSFPPEKRGQAFALFGIAVVVAPVIGPTLGGWISDNWSWQWCFEINGPVGLIALALLSVTLRDSEAAGAEPKRHAREGSGLEAGLVGLGFDWVGFALVATFLGALEIALDRGLEDDWFGSTFIVGVVAVCVLAFILMIPWELSRRNPAVDVRMVATRQFGACFVVMLATGAILLSTTQFLPQLVQAEYGYTATWAGLVLSPGGIVTAIMMPVVGKLSTKIQPRTLIAAGAIACALAMFDMTRINGDLDFQFFAISRMLLGIGLPLIFLPILTASFAGIARNKTDMASALINMARNTGGSIGISIANNVLAHRQQFHQSRLVELANSSTVQFQGALKQATDYFMAQGASLATAQHQAFAWIGQQVQTQSTLLAYIDVFWALTLISAAAVPLALILRKVKLGGPAPAAH
jgi:MFS transporter, DHA2 family, multidrug resistance protein